jgi:hypothetical protein
MSGASYGLILDRGLPKTNWRGHTSLILFLEKRRRPINKKMRNRKTEAENRFIWAVLVFAIIVLAIAFYYYATR